MVFALDASGSVGKENFMLIMQFAEDMVVGLPIEAGARVSNIIQVILEVLGPEFKSCLIAMSYLYFR